MTPEEGISGCRTKVNACGWCTSPLPVRARRGRPARYCSEGCRRAAYNEARRGDFSVRSCTVCGVDFVPEQRSNQRYCSEACRNRRRAKVTRAEHNARISALGVARFRELLKDSEWRRETYARASATKAIRKGWRRVQRAEATVRRPPPLMLMPGPPIRQRTPTARRPRLFLAGLCHECGQPYVTVGRARARFCSARCGERSQRRMAKKQRRSHKRRARAKTKAIQLARRGIVVDIMPYLDERIFERDHWDCMLCGGALKRDAKVPHPKAPTIDHIVPLALGGDDTAANVQAAHFSCNSRKHTKACGSQLRLFG